MIAEAPSAYAYSGSAAASYANEYALSPNSNYYPVYSDDCTNFVSQANWAGGQPEDIDGYNNYNGWWKTISRTGNAVQLSYSWTDADDYYMFLTNPGSYGTIESVEDGTDISVAPFGTMKTGDVYFYEWGTDGTIDHSTIMVSTGGTDPNSGIYGDLVDSHTTNRVDAIWSLEPYNANRNTTYIYAIHLNV